MASLGTKLLYALTVLISAFLLFQVQPILSKFILPWFGGVPAVWSACVLFFQSVLFLGYAYAHLLQQKLSPRLQALLHLTMIVIAVACLPIEPDETWTTGDWASGADVPAFQILLLLGVAVGVPYFVLSSTGPLISAWYSRSFPDRSPYRLYALSNFGSLAALLSYPFLVEPNWDLVTQSNSWGWGFGLFAVLCAASTLAALFTSQPAVRSERDRLEEHGGSQLLSRRTRLLWIALPAMASFMLLATTNFVCQDVAAIPFLWVVPLSLYLLSFIICFDRPDWYRRKLFAGLFLGTIALAMFYLPLVRRLDLPQHYIHELVVYFAAMFCFCMVCHGELAHIRPEPRGLTGYYLSISAGGALGGLFVSLVAPLIFPMYLEWILGLLVACGLCLRLVLGPTVFAELRKSLRYILPATAVAILVVLAMAGKVLFENRQFVAQRRNFYGVVSVWDVDLKTPQYARRVLGHGRIIHGSQFLDPAKKMEPRSYFGAGSGIAQVLAFYKERGPVRVAVAGLGIGTLAAYARPGDVFRFYELNPQVVELAERHFSFLADSQGTVQHVLGDARLALKNDKVEPFDVIVLDAFSGDSVPTHLLTMEAFDIYRQRLKPGGAICVNISNEYLDLSGVVRRLATEQGYQSMVLKWRPPASWTYEQRKEQGLSPNDWVIMSQDQKLFVSLQKSAAKIDGAVVEREPVDSDSKSAAPLWTDQRTDLFQILR
ncbi:MAG: fused MFS/spermidine synthase [Planctomycetota bacterium]|nr:fused MFS/spermidine synthase [Planctomycetota bacterium]